MSAPQKFCNECGMYTYSVYPVTVKVRIGKMDVRYRDSYDVVTAEVCFTCLPTPTRANLRRAFAT